MIVLSDNCLWPECQMGSKKKSKTQMEENISDTHSSTLTDVKYKWIEN